MASWGSPNDQILEQKKKFRTYGTIALISHSGKVMLKILQANFQQYLNHELPDVHAGFRKVWFRTSNCQHPLDHQKAREFQNNIFSALLTTPKPLTVSITTNSGKFLKRWEYQTTWPASWEYCMQVKKQQLEPDIEQWAGSKLGKEYNKAVYCHPVYLIYMQNTSCKLLGWINHKP